MNSALHTLKLSGQKKTPFTACCSWSAFVWPQLVQASDSWHRRQTAGIDLRQLIQTSHSWHKPQTSGIHLRQLVQTSDSWYRPQMEGGLQMLFREQPQRSNEGKFLGRENSRRCFAKGWLFCFTKCCKVILATSHESEALSFPSYRSLPQVSRIQMCQKRGDL